MIDDDQYDQNYWGRGHELAKATKELFLKIKEKEKKENVDNDKNIIIYRK